MIGIAVFALFFAVSVSGDEEPCRNCDKNVDTVFSMVGRGCEGMEPIVMNDIEVCAEVTVTGVKTIKRSGEACITHQTGDLYTQKVGVGFDEVHFSCVLKQLQEFGKAVGIPIPPIPSIPFVKSDPKRIIKGSWKNMNMRIKMDIDFDKDTQNITEAVIEDGNVSDFQLGCEGDGPLMAVAGLITKSEEVRSLIGVVVKVVIKLVITKVMNSAEIAPNLALLNCGED